MEAASFVADPISEEQFFTIVCGLIELLGMSVGVMERMIEKPQYLDSGTPNRRFRFVSPDERTFQVLMCVRVASALRAAAILLRNYQTTEVGMLFRPIDDFLADIMYVDEIVENGSAGVTVAQQQFLDRYFIDDKLNIEERMAHRKKINYNERRQKVQASEARYLGGDNPDRTKKIVQVVDDVFSGVVHGDYLSTMETYGGDTLDETAFHVDGLPVRFPEYRHHLALYVHRALNAFSKVAFNLGQHELAAKLREARITFEKTPAYTNV